MYTESTRGIVDSVLDGYNATVFAYGATGSGKTHTMMGNDRVGPGVMGLAMCELWQKIESAQDEFDFEVSVSCLEVYNETLHDLFVPDSAALEMWDDPQGHAVVSKLSVLHPHTVEEVQRMLMEANMRRRQSPTDANQESSRSHAVFQVTVTKKPKASGVTANVLEGKLNLIDLAGSERASKTNNRSERLREGANINKSLLALANCINALGQNYHSGQHIPFRNSKLTRLLKDSLGGTSRTTMIAAISPSSLSFEDTHNTLKYASRTRNIKINATRKVIPVRANLGQYRDMIESLNAQVTQLRARLKDAEARQTQCACIRTQPPNVQDIAARLQRLYTERASMFRQLLGAEQRIATLVSRTTGAAAAAAAADDDKSAQLLADARALREKVASMLAYNEKGLGLVFSEITRLPQPARDIVTHEAHALAYDAQVAQGAYAERSNAALTALVTDVSATGLIPVDHPLAARIRAIVLDGTNTAAFFACPDKASSLPFATAAAAGAFDSPPSSPTPPTFMSSGRRTRSSGSHGTILPVSMRPAVSSPPLHAMPSPQQQQQQQPLSSSFSLKRTAAQARVTAQDPQPKRVALLSDDAAAAAAAATSTTTTESSASTYGLGARSLGSSLSFAKPYGGRVSFAPSASTAAESAAGEDVDMAPAASAAAASASASARPPSKDYTSRFFHPSTVLSMDAAAFLPPADNSGRQLRSILKTSKRFEPDASAAAAAAAAGSAVGGGAAAAAAGTALGGGGSGDAAPVTKSVKFSDVQSYSDGQTASTRGIGLSGTRSPARFFPGLSGAAGGAAGASGSAAGQASSATAAAGVGVGAKRLNALGSVSTSITASSFVLPSFRSAAAAAAAASSSSSASSAAPGSAAALQTRPAKPPIFKP